MKDRLQENKQLRRAIRRLLLHYGASDTRHITTIVARAYKIPKQRVAGNLRSMVYDSKSCTIQTHIPGVYSVATPANSKIA